MKRKPAGRPIEILMVEDNPGDVRLTKEAFNDHGVKNNLTVVANGVEAMAFLRGEGKYAGVARPDLILLDLNLPKKNGCEVLADIQEDPDLSRIPVVVLTTSKAQDDIAKTYGLYANCYLTKPVGFEQFGELVRAIECFWLTGVERSPDGKA